MREDDRERGAGGPASSAEPSDAGGEEEESRDQLSGELEPRDFWEDLSAKQQLARFDSSSATAPQAMPMLVAIRMRPMWEKEVEAGDYNCIRIIEGKVVIVIDPWYDPELNKNREREKRYAFDKVFDEQVGQETVYEETAHGLVGGVLDGYNASVFAYGATGAGKTHTMLGAIDQPGVMVNTLYDMFTRMQTDEEFRDKKFKVTLSYLEIYNELIKDLLLPSSVDLKLHEDPVRGMVVQGITEYGAESADEILELLHRGNLHRSVEPTAANQVSSRSHAVLQVTVEQAEKTAHVTGNVRIGKLSMVDLAGSERASKTENRGDRLKEGANINRSLLALGNCITALAEGGRSHVPFRDSKMTRLLKDSLGGNCRTVMIANISPSHRQFEETVNTLKYANRAKNLKTQVARNVMSVSAHIAEYQRIIMELRNEVADLKAAAAHANGNRLPPVHSLREDTRLSERNQRLSAVDYVDNLEKRHMVEIEEAVTQACAERRGLLVELTELTQKLMKAQSANATAGASPNAEEQARVHDAIISVRNKLLSNQQDVQDIIGTAVNRISSSERLQLLQLFVRGKFMEVLNEQFQHELEWRREMQQRAVSEGHLPPELMSVAMTTESWLAEHRPPMDFHAKMAYVEIGGAQGMTIPSIAQLLDQNLISPQQAISAQNIGALVRPFTQQTLGMKPPSPVKLPSLPSVRLNAVAEKGGGNVRRSHRSLGDAGLGTRGSLPELGAESAMGASTRTFGSEQVSRDGDGPEGRASPTRMAAGDGDGRETQGARMRSIAGRDGATTLSRIEAQRDETPPQVALRGLKRNTSNLRRRGSRGDGLPGQVQGLEGLAVTDDGRADAHGSRSDSRGPSSPDSDRLTVRASDLGSRSRSVNRTLERQRKPPIRADSTRRQPNGSYRAPQPDGRYNGKPQRINAINGAYGVSQPGQRPSPGRPRVPGRPASNAGGAGVVRVVNRDGLRRQDLPPAAPSQARAQRLQQQRERRGVGAGRQVANPALRPR